MIQTKDKAKGIELVNKALKRVEEVIKAHKGNFLKKSEPKVIGEKEGEEESEALEKLENENKLAGSSEEEEEGMDIEVTPAGMQS